MAKEATSIARLLPLLLHHLYVDLNLHLLLLLMIIIHHEVGLTRWPPHPLSRKWPTIAAILDHQRAVRFTPGC